MLLGSSLGGYSKTEGGPEAMVCVVTALLGFAADGRVGRGVCVWWVEAAHDRSLELAFQKQFKGKNGMWRKMLEKAYEAF